MKSRKSITSKKRESLWGKIRCVIHEQMSILNNDDFNQKLEHLNRRTEQIQCEKKHGEVAKTLLKKVSKLESNVNAVMAHQEEAFSEMAVYQTMLPGADYQHTVLDQLQPSAFYPGTINIPTSFSNTLLPSPYHHFTSAHVSEHISSNEAILFSMENQNSATASNSAIPYNQMSTHGKMRATAQCKMKKTPSDRSRRRKAQL